MRPARLALRLLGGLVALLVLLVSGAYLAACHALPGGGVTGAGADALAHQVEQAVEVAAWQRTGAVRFTFAGHHHLWDRQRGLARVRWGEREVLLDLGSRRGVARVRGALVEGGERDRLLEAAWRMWINDTFWLNPLAKLFDEGTSRTRFDAATGPPRLLVRYASGGVTPGDAYLWLLDEKSRPRAWRLYVRILPIRGIEFTWEGWTRLPTGALVSTEHRVLGMRAVTIGELLGGSTLAEVEPGPDPFAEIAPR